MPFHTTHKEKKNLDQILFVGITTGPQVVFIAMSTQQKVGSRRNLYGSDQLSGEFSSCAIENQTLGDSTVIKLFLNPEVGSVFLCRIDRTM